ncbi:hypothetical protein F4774DRAFT_406525 [Daldinia eschscholtzii]|nr:hypothetical protein F4774DRAFT_406525 [Daldinia eschscholtzii]
MEPLTAIALAGNVLQFIEYTSGLLSTSVEVYKSAAGTSDANLTLEKIYRHLSDLSSRLRAGGMSPRSSATESALRSIADHCDNDCIRILTALNNLRVDNGGHRVWKSFRVALKLAWKGEKEIEQLASQLRDRQLTMTLHICAISNEWLQDMNQKLQNLKEQNQRFQLQISNRLEGVVTHLQEVKILLHNSELSRACHVFSAAEIDNLAAKVSHVSIAERDFAKEQAILNSLDYGFRSARHENIIEAHKHTFDWIFETSDQEINDGKRFLKWIHSSDGVFWISGKPGSGKSTLMKFLVDHAKTRKAVETWASPEKAVIASHFFWSAGISMQKSLQGLLQSLLYDIFRQCPELIAEVCPSRWKATNSPNADRQGWKLDELIRCLRGIKTNNILAPRFCFFIDGLDEFDGDYIEISQILREIANSSKIKLCIASRPLNEFLDQFGTTKSSILSIHELTKRYILSYAQSRLQTHPRWSVLGLDIHAAQLFLEKIADIARGVFLWVTLVTQSLRNGLTNYDTMEDLNARLDSLPKSLEAFYKQMLDSVDPIYHRKSANLLQMQVQVHKCNAQPERLPWSMPWMIALLHEREYDNPDYAITMPKETITHTDIQSLREQATRRLNAKCHGILEIKGPTLEFIHRTALDYLKTPEMTEYIQNRSGRGFVASLSVLRAYVACLKIGIWEVVGNGSLILEDGDVIDYPPNFWVPLRYAESAKEEGADDAVVYLLMGYLDRLSMSMVRPRDGNDIASRTDIWITPLGELRGSLESSPFIRQILWTSLRVHEEAALGVKYLFKKLSGNPDRFRQQHPRALLDLMDLSIQFFFPQGTIRILHTLLRNGYDPNSDILERRTVPLIRDCGPIVWVGDENSNSISRGRRPITRSPEPVRISCWATLLIFSGISESFGPRRRLESAIHQHCKSDGNGFTYPGANALNHALRSDVFSLLLLYGADPNAHLTPLVTAWSDFLRFAIKNSSKITAVDAYLNSLDDFFKHGADLGASTIGLTLRPGDTSSHLPLCMVTGWDIFCEALEDLTGSETEKELVFISKVTMRMIEQAIITRWPVGRLPCIVKSVFPDILLKPMLDMLGQAQVKGMSLEARGKRPLEETVSTEESKRLKSYAADITRS